MKLTQERAGILPNSIQEDVGRAKTLLESSLENALVHINKLSCDFTIEDLDEYGQAVSKPNASLIDDVLEGVAGRVSNDSSENTVLYIVPRVVIHLQYGHC